jgi:2'-5' RNA ligase
MHASSEKKGLKLHVTLGRVKAWQWAKMEEEERPEIKKEISFVFEVSSIEVMESKLRPKGPDYTVLESAPLKK